MNFIDQINTTEILKAFMILFAVIDIVGSIPIIIKLKEKAGDIHEVKASVVAFLLMITFLFVGKSLLDLLGVNIEAFAVAGALIILALAVEMIFGIELFREEEHSSKVVSIVPVAFPLIAGAGVMTTLISLRVEYHEVNIAIAVLLNMIIVFFVLKLTRRIENFIGKGGIAILKKVFGIILLAIAVKLFAENAKMLFI